MFGNYDYTNFPQVKVKFSKSIENDDDFSLFTNTWKEINDKQKHFSFLFDTRDVGFVNLKYAKMMSLFIKKMKENENNVLDFTIIIVNSTFVRYCLKLIFSITTPIAPVYILSNEEDEKKLYNKLVNNIHDLSDIDYSFISN